MNRSIGLSLIIAVASILCCTQAGFGKCTPQEDNGEILDNRQTNLRFQTQLLDIKSNGRIRPRAPGLPLQNESVVMDLQWKGESPSHRLSKYLNYRRLAFIGPKNVGGRTQALVVDRSNPNHFLGGTSWGGLWTSDNQGEYWNPVDDQAMSLSIIDVIQSRHEADTYYIITSLPTGFFKRDGDGLPPGAGVYKLSTSTHANTITPLGATFRDPRFLGSWCIAEDPLNQGRLFVGTESAGLLATDDDGLTWTAVCQPMFRGAPVAVTDILAFARSTGTETKTNILIGSKKAGLYLSKENGDKDSFHQVGKSEYPISFERVVLANCQSKPWIVYCAFGKLRGQKGLAGLLYSDDFGLTWKQRNVQQIGGTSLGDYCLMLGVHPIDPNKVVCGLVSMFSSYDGGLHWKRVFLSGPDLHAYVPENDHTFLIGNDHGIHRFSWGTEKPKFEETLNQGLNTTQFYGGDGAELSISPEGQVQAKAVGGTQDNGVWAITPKGSKKIVNANINSDAVDSWFSRQHTDRLLIATAFTIKAGNGAIARSRDDMSNWNFLPFPKPMILEGFDFFNAYTMSRYNHHLVVCRTDQAVWRSLTSWHRNQADTKWHRLTDGLQEGIFSLCVRKNDLFYGGRHSLMGRVSNINSVSVKPETTHLTDNVPLDGYITAIGEHATDTDQLFVGFGNYSDAQPPESRAFRLTHVNSDAPVWHDIGKNLPANLPINCLKHLQLKNGSVLFAGTDLGLYWSIDEGASWQKETKIPNVPVFTIKLHRETHSVFVFTYGRGIWGIRHY